MKKIWKRVALSVLGLGVVAILVIAFLPKPVMVEMATVERGSLQIAIESEGKTRVRDRYVLTAPVTGRLARVDLIEGDRVESGAPVASIYPPALDAMQREELDRRIEAAEWVVRQANVAVDEASTRLQQGERDRDRARAMGVAGSIARQDLDHAEDVVTAATGDLAAARFRAEGAASELAVARAGRMAVTGGHAVVLRSPVRGSVLRVREKSEHVVQAGTPILEIGNPLGLEIVIDVLSSDAVKVEPGASILIEGWGGERPLRARVAYVEPSGFTKISALGVEEQRVNVIAELLEPAVKLGDGYRVEARIVQWEGTNVLKVPTSALFRDGEEWNLFTAEDGVAHRRRVKVGRMSSFEAEIISGLREGARVIVHPPDNVVDGARVAIR